jgi:Bax protein
MARNKFLYGFLLAGVLLLSARLHARGNPVARYIEKYRGIADSLSEEFGIPASIILGVAVVESSAGAGQAVKALNNHFGITGKNHLARKGKPHSRYKQYTCARESFRDFCKMVSKKRFYEKTRCNPDPKVWLKAMSACHYSQIPAEWQKRVLTVIKSYNLNSL